MSWLKRSLLVAAVGVAAAGCEPQKYGRPVSSGSLAMSQDSQYLYAADTDTSKVIVVDAKTLAWVADVQVGTAPVRVVVGGDDTIYSVNRGDDSVSVIRRGEWKEAARVKVGVEPVGIALSPDSRTLYVTNSTARDAADYGTLSSIDTATLTTNWELPIGADPRGIAVIDHGARALVSLYKQGEVVEVDLIAGKVKSAGSNLYDRANASRSVASGGSAPSTFRMRGMNDLIAVPDGTRVFAPVIIAREDPLTTRPNPISGYYSSQGPCNVGAVASPGVVTLDTRAQPEAQVDDLTSCFGTGLNDPATDFPVTSLVGTVGRGGFGAGTGTPAIVQGPTVGVVDQSGQFIYVVNRESQNVAVVPAYRRTGDDLNFGTTGSSVRSLTKVGAGSDGIAISGDNAKAYVYSQFDHKVQVIVEASGATQFDPKGTVVLGIISAALAVDDLTPAQRDGRRLFFDAIDARMSNPSTGVSCATCHLEGTEDNHVWGFPDGKRQTPALAGRQLLATAPYHWSGEFPTLQAFASHTIVERMGGSGITSIMGEQIDAFIGSLPAPRSPVKTANAAGVTRGRTVFEKASCDSCHSGALLTNNQSADVGTLNSQGNNRDNGMVAISGFNVPSLLGLGRSAPYLHDGSALTLETRVFNNPGDRHGVTSGLSVEEKADLVTYLKSL
jgi:YVTN family beta-propeller protein